MNKILSIVIPVYNKYNFTKSCLKDLSQLPNDHEIIIVDDASSDDTQKELKDFTEVIYHRNDKNTCNFSRSCNIGYSLATANNVLFLNNDIRVKSDHSTWTQNLIKKCEFAIVGPTMGQLDNKFNFVQEANRMLPGNSYLSGWCMASSKNNFNKLAVNRKPNEIWDEDIPFYFDDTNLAFEARELNIPMEVIEVPVVHFGKTSSKELNIHKLYLDGKERFTKKWKKYLK